MGFSKGLTKQILTENRILPLFDGLDELAEEKRADCLNAIAEYGTAQKANYVICSRIEEYANTIDAPVYCQIMVKPLTLTQIKQGLEEDDSPEARGILHAIKVDPLLREAIKTPFYLNTVQLLFSTSKPWEEFGFKSR
jgi:predicted NACHT family NTPase